MKIPNPWPWHPHTRCNVNNGECICVLPGGHELEVPDTAVEVLIEPVEKGRSDARVVAQSKIWSKSWGMLDLEDHLKKMEMQKEEADLRKRQEKERKRREKEAKERAATPPPEPETIPEPEPQTMDEWTAAAYDSKD